MGATREEAARRGRPHRRSALPWLLLSLLFLSEALAGGRASDIDDTHARLKRLYKELGIERKTDEPEESRGCSCLRPKDRGRAEQQPVRISRRSMPPIVGYILLGAILLALIVPLAFSLRSAWARGQGLATAEPEIEEEEEAAPERTPWRVDLDECRRLMSEGRVVEAFASLHRATLLALQREGRLTLDESSTNWEYVRRLSPDVTLSRTLASVTHAAEDAVLGERPPPADQYWELERQVLALARGEG